MQIFQGPNEMSYNPSVLPGMHQTDNKKQMLPAKAKFTFVQNILNVIWHLVEKASKPLFSLSLDVL